MDIIFFIIVVLSFIIPFFYKKKNITISILLFLMIILIIKYPSSCVAASKDGLDLWLYMVLPSLLPFFIINDMLVALRIPDSISVVLAPIASKLFNTSGYGAYVFIMSIFSGYPSGARIATELVSDHRITSAEGQRILTFSSTSGPLFIIGVVGTAMLDNPAAGYVLLFSHIFGSIANGIFFSFVYGRKKQQNSYHTAVLKAGNQDKSISKMFADATMQSFYTCVYIGGYVIMFSVINSLLDKIGFFKIISSILVNIFMLPHNIAKIMCAFMESSLEISNGSKILSQLDASFELKMILLSFMLAFSGISILGQVSGIIHKTKIKLRPYMISKITQGLISSFICWLVLQTNTIHRVVAASSFSGNTLSSYSIMGWFLYLLLLILVLLLMVFTASINKH